MDLSKLALMGFTILLCSCKTGWWTPSYLEFTVGQGSYNTVDPNWQGPYGEVTAGFVIARSKKAEDSQIGTLEELKKLNNSIKEQNRLQEKQYELETQEAVFKGILSDSGPPPPEPTVMEKWFSMGEGPLGVPYALWTSLVAVMWAIAHKLGLKVPIKFKGKK